MQTIVVLRVTHSESATNIPELIRSWAAHASKVEAVSVLDFHTFPAGQDPAVTSWPSILPAEDIPDSKAPDSWGE